MKIHSKPDSRGMWFIDCTECTKGASGDKSCSAGWTVKKPNHGGCFMGNLLPKIEEQIS